MKSTLEEARAALAKSKDDMAQYYNQRRTPAPKFKISEKVFLDTADISMTRPTKTPPEIIGGKERYEVEEVVDSRLRYRKLEYLVRWKGYGQEENSWIAEKDLNAPDLVTTFYRMQPNTPKRISALAFGRMGSQPFYQ
jgi:hypothetical protein